MKSVFKISSILILSLCMLFNVEVFGQKTPPPLRVILFTGGHSFDRPAFDVFKNSLPGITVTEVTHPNALVMFRPENRSLYDVILLYDMPAAINEQEKKDFIDCLKAGKGLVVWHHAFGGYKDWPEYQNIMGGRYQFGTWTDSQGVKQPASVYLHDVKFRVKVADKKHPVTKGINDFDVLDETYGVCAINPGVHVLLTTDEKTSVPSVAWTNRYGKSKVVTILLGHDDHSWSNPEAKKLLIQAIHWVK